MSFQNREEVHQDESLPHRCTSTVGGGERIMCIQGHKIHPARFHQKREETKLNKAGGVG